jgi:ATPase subunit of ABC transporter with duplicated ATPase domains
MPVSTTASVDVRHLTCTLPDGQTPFHHLNLQLDQRATGLTGRNGSGKSLLAALIAGVSPPSQGEVHHAVPVAYLPQHPDVTATPDVAALSGHGAVLNALRRLEEGHGTPQDVERAEGQWDLRERLQQALSDAGLRDLPLATASRHLSGGEATRVMLAGLWLRSDHYLVLDEPGNHLDAAGRDWLRTRIRQHRPGVLLVSHDRTLLDGMTRILSLDNDGLHSFSGGYQAWRQHRAQRQRTAQQALDHARAAKRRGERALQTEHDRQQHRAAAGRHKGRDSNQAQILLDRQKERSEGTAGAHQRRRSAQRDALAAQVRDAAARVADAPGIHFLSGAATPPAGRRVLTLDQLVLPHNPPQRPPLTLTLTGAQRLALTGDNGSGKSTLLRTIAGQCQPVAGQCSAQVPVALLTQDQHLGDATHALAALLAADPTLSIADARTRLAQAGLDEQAIVRPPAQLSGGERLKAALLCALSRTPTPQLLLLDEPDNHIDPDAIDAVEHLLRTWQGALIVVSHARPFLEALALTGELALHAGGWQLTEHRTGQAP